jgi:hypothetical protein
MAQPASEKTADPQKHHTAPTHVAKKDNPVPTKEAPKTAEAPKTESAQKKGLFGLLKKAAVGDSTPTDKPSTPPSKSADAQAAPPSKNTDTETSASTKKKGIFGFLKKNKNNQTNTNTNKEKTTNAVSN